MLSLKRVALSLSLVLTLGGCGGNKSADKTDQSSEINRAAHANSARSNESQITVLFENTFDSFWDAQDVLETARSFVLRVDGNWTNRSLLYAPDSATSPIEALVKNVNLTRTYFFQTGIFFSHSAQSANEERTAPLIIFGRTAANNYKYIRAVQRRDPARNRNTIHFSLGEVRNGRQSVVVQNAVYHYVGDSGAHLSLKVEGDSVGVFFQGAYTNVRYRFPEALTGRVGVIFSGPEQKLDYLNIIGSMEADNRTLVFLPFGGATPPDELNYVSGTWLTLGANLFAKIPYPVATDAIAVTRRTVMPERFTVETKFAHAPDCAFLNATNNFTCDYDYWRGWGRNDWLQDGVRGVIFDYQSPGNFKWLELSKKPNYDPPFPGVMEFCTFGETKNGVETPIQGVFCQTGGRRSRDVEFEALIPAPSYPYDRHQVVTQTVFLRIDGNKVTPFINGINFGTFTYPRPLNRGAVGVWQRSSHDAAPTRSSWMARRYLAVDYFVVRDQ